MKLNFARGETIANRIRSSFNPSAGAVVLLDGARFAAAACSHDKLSQFRIIARTSLFDLDFECGVDGPVVGALDRFDAVVSQQLDGR